jgi:hypothetical protein
MVSIPTRVLPLGTELCLEAQKESLMDWLSLMMTSKNLSRNRNDRRNIFGRMNGTMTL